MPLEERQISSDFRVCIEKLLWSSSTHCYSLQLFVYPLLNTYILLRDIDTHRTVVSVRQQLYGIHRHNAITYASTYGFWLHRHIAIICIDTQMSIGSTVDTLQSSASTPCYRLHSHRYHLRRHTAIVCIVTLLQTASTHCYRLHRHIALDSVDTLISSVSTHSYRLHCMSLHRPSSQANKLTLPVSHNVPTNCYHMRRRISIVCVKRFISSGSTHQQHLRRHIVIFWIDTLVSSASTHCHCVR